MNNPFGHVLLPFITPFGKDESVDLDVFEKLLEYAIKKDFLDTVILTGTTGEFNTLTFDERVSIYKRAVKVVSGRYPIIAGTGCGSTKETVALTKAAAEAGIKTVMVVAPFYCKPTQEGIFQHYKRVADEVDVNILVYNIPIFTGVNVEPATLRRLVEYSDKFIGVKDESGVNPVQIMDYEYATRDVNPNFLLFNGDDIMLMSTICLGAQGIVSGGALLVGDRIKKIFKLYEAGRNDEATELFRDVFRLCRCFCDGRTHPNPKLRKAVEMASGLKVGPARLPLNAPDEAETAGIAALLKDLQLI